VKLRFIIALLITGLLVISAGAEENGSVQNRNSVTANSSRPQTSSRAARPQAGERQVPPGSRDDYAERGSDNSSKDKIVVDVWSSATEEPDTTKLSPGFAVAALNAASRLQLTERKMANSIKMGYPLGEFWIQTDFDAIDESLRLSAVSATTDADRQALQLLNEQTSRLRLWSDWMIEQKNQMRLANYYISPAPLDNDERFQNTVACTTYLISTLASGRLQEENRSCR